MKLKREILLGLGAFGAGYLTGKYRDGSNYDLSPDEIKNLTPAQKSVLAANIFVKISSEFRKIEIENRKLDVNDELKRQLNAKFNEVLSPKEGEKYIPEFLELIQQNENILPKDYVLKIKNYFDNVMQLVNKINNTQFGKRRRKSRKSRKSRKMKKSRKNKRSNK